MKAPSDEQKERLRDLGRELREQHHGKAKTGVVLKARYGHTRKAYQGAPQPDLMRRLTFAWADVCKANAATTDYDFFESDVARPRTLRTYDPGPPKDASPVSFLGPLPTDEPFGDLDEICASGAYPATASPPSKLPAVGSTLTAGSTFSAYKTLAPLVVPLLSPAGANETASTGWRATASTTRSGFGWDVQRIKFNTRDGELNPESGSVTIFASGSATSSQAGQAFVDNDMCWEGRRDKINKLFYIGIMCDVPQDVVSVSILQAPTAEGDEHTADEVRMQKLVTSEFGEALWMDADGPVRLEAGILQSVYDAKTAPKVPAKRLYKRRTEAGAQAAIRDAASKKKLFKERYTLGKRLNAGMEGVTYLAKVKFSGCPVVVKKPNDASNTADYDLLRKKTHPNILRVFEICRDQVETYVVMEHCEGGDLFRAIEKMKVPTQNWCSAVFRQVLWGVKYLHESFNEAHNDLKPENIFLDRTPAGPHDVPRAVIGDFGCLARIGEVGDGGDPRYRAPETFDTNRYGTETDMWALGVTLYEIVSGGLLIYIDTPNVSSWDKFRKTDAWTKFHTLWQRGVPPNFHRLDAKTVVEDEQHSRTRGSGRPETEQLKVLLTGLLQVNPERRFTVDNALHEPWMHLSHTEKPIPFEPEVTEALAGRARRHVLDIALLNLIGSCLQGESIRHYQNLWNKYDVDADGQMWFEEFEKMCTDMDLINDEGGFAWVKTKHQSTDEVPSIQDLFMLADVNQSGAIEFREFVGLMFDQDQVSPSDCQQYIKEAFRRLAGADELLSAEELAGVFAHEDAPPEGPEVVAAIFNDMDKDENGYVDLAEFSSYIDNL